MKPLAVDLCSGLGGWTEGLLAEGWDCIGFDIERHKYGSRQYPAQLVLQDILTLDGRQFRGKVSLIVASPPCQRYSYMAMPWTRAKALAEWHLDPQHPERVVELNALFNACVRIGTEAGCPLVIENVRGAQRWVGRSRWAYGSFHLWGDVPALMPITAKHVKVKTMGAGWYPPGHPKHVPGLGFNTHADRALRSEYFADDLTIPRAVKEGRLTPEQGESAKAILCPPDDSVKVGGPRGDDWFTHHNRPEFEERATKNDGGSWFNVAHNTISGKGQNPDGRKTSGHVNQRDGVKSPGGGAEGWFGSQPSPMRRHSSKSNARKAASARIAKIPEALARHIARVYFPPEFR